MPALALALLCLWNGSAAADFRLCNNTSSRVGIALGYKDAEGWTTEGWWNVSSRSCETLLRGTLVARYYYIYALDYDRGGEWSGQAFMCSRDKEFTIKGTENCLARGFDRTGFFEVDTGEQRAWTVQLTESNEQQPAQRVPGIPGTVGPGGLRNSHSPGIARPAQSAGRDASGRDWSAASRSARNQAMRRLRRIKILATLGPASSDSAMIRRLFEAGADVFRINMSHTSHDKMRELVKTIRNVESSYGRPIGILVDLQGPKLRLGSFAEGAIQLNNGESFVLDSDKTPGDNTRVQLPHPEILAALRPGHALLLDDGKVRLIVEETSPDRAVTRVVIGGRMSDRKGVSLPDTDLPVSAMTPKDRADLEAALVTGVDWIALSFVQRAEDVVEAKKLIRGRAAVMSKIEKPQAIDRLPEILEASDALMVARGDLGVELPLERVPSLQKQMTRLARRAGKPVVVATQMLESMIQSPVPTRAEVSDVATAVYEGADAIMLSAESAAGKFPVEAVSTMNRIGEEVERDPTYRGVRQCAARRAGADRRRCHRGRRAADRRDARSVRDHLLDQFGIDRAAGRARTAEAAGGGDHAQSRHRTQAVGGLGRALRGRRRRTRPRRHGQPRRLSIAFRDGFARAGQRVIIVAGVPLRAPGTTNMLRIASVGPDGDAEM